MEKKKELLIKVLKKLQPHWNLAEGFLALVESEYVDEDAMNGLAKVIADKIKNIKKAHQVLWNKKLKDLEQQHHELEAKDIQDAEDMLGNL